MVCERSVRERSANAAEEGVQAYGGSYLSVTSSGSIRYELGVMRFPCSEIAMSDGFEKQILAPTVPRCVHASDLSFKICVSQILWWSGVYLAIKTVETAPVFV